MQEQAAEAERVVVDKFLNPKKTMNNMKKLMKMIAMIGLLLPGWILPAFSQSDKELLSELIADDRESVDALVMYPADTRLAILEVAMNPEILMRMKGIQNKTQNSFLEIVQPLSKDEQEQVYQLTRYPDLLASLVVGGKKSNAVMREIVAAYPEDIQPAAEDLGRKRYDELAAIHRLSASAHDAMETVLTGYPADIQESARKLLDLPEVVGILTENMQLTVLAGDVYRQDPEWVLQKADSLNFELARAQAEELVEWKKNLENDPEAKKELAASADAYAQEQGVRSEVNRSPDLVNMYVHYAPFSYWFGYPYWYSYTSWYPYPYWWDWGFYYGPSNQMIVFGLPSYHFVHWHFYDYQHHYQYAYLSNFYYRHYEHHPHSATSIAVVARSWEQSDRNTINKDWLANSNNRVERFREFGKMEGDYQKQARIAPEKTPTRAEFVTQNRAAYPELNRVPNLRTQDPQRETALPQTRSQDEMNRPPANQIQPQVRPPAQRERPQIYTRPNYQPQRNEQVTQPRQPDRAAEYHQERWEQQRQPTVTPPRQRQPAVVQPQRNQPAVQPSRQQPTRSSAPVRQENPVEVKPQKRN